VRPSAIITFRARKTTVCSGALNGERGNEDRLKAVVKLLDRMLLQVSRVRRREIVLSRWSSPGINIDKCLENELQGRALNGNAC
jgi:hypothetical protein